MNEQRRYYLMTARDEIATAIISSDEILHLCNYLVSKGELTDDIILEIK